MKKLTSILVVLVLTLSLGFAALANDITSSINVTFNKIKVVVNGNSVDGDNILYKGTTYIPLRKVSESMGCKVEYDSNTHIANITSNTNNEKLEGMKIGKCIDKYQEGEFITCRFEINNNGEKEYCITYTNDFEVGKSYGILGNHWIIDREGYEHEIETFELYGWSK